MRSIRVYLAAMATVLAGLFLLGGMATTAGAKPKQKPAKHKVVKKKASKLKTAPKITSGAPYQARGSVGDAYVKNAAPGTKLLLVNAKNKIVRTGKADSYGSKVFYDVTPGAIFTVRTPKGKGAQGTKKFRVLKPGANPPQSFYNKKTLHAGLNYVTMRDGTELAMTVRPPWGKTLDEGPFPTFIEYSGYQTAAPHDLLDSIIGQIGGGGGGSDDLAPATSTAVGSVIGPLLDFATVSVQMRGSGCSGGAFDLFGWPTTYDGYDAVETVAAQPWAQGKVGMGGISFSGISQLFTAGTNPPHLAAVSPLSVTDDVYQATGFPGGIFNSGFAYSWITERANDAKPAPAGGQPWARIMSTTGDPDVTDPALQAEQKQHCIDNQKMRLQTRNYNKLIETNPYRTPQLFSKRSPGAWVKNIKVPIFWVGAFQDEQTGGHWPEAVKNLPKNNKDVWVTMQNGVHVDSLGPSTITRWAEFMNLFVGDGRIPVVPPLVLGVGSTLYDFLADAGALPIQQSRFAEMEDTPANIATARSEFRKDPRIRLLMDNGAAVPGDPGAIGAKWEADFNSWPIASTKPTSYYLGKGGTLTTSKPKAGSAASYKSDPSARPAKTLGENAQGDSWLAQPPYNWQPVAAGKGLGFISPALGKDLFMAGPSSLDLYLKSNMANTDIQVTLTEVRPDGKETYVQNGWLRSSHRKINPKASTAYNPVQTWLKKDAAPLKKGKYNYERIQIFPAAHVFRAGSKIRINIQAPGGDRTIWDFATIEKGKTKNTIGLGGAIPSKLVLPVIPGQTSEGNPLPSPTALRGQPSRDYVPAGNGG
ncbi:MAG: CocE/NonD family hydrolase [Solirubrobacterales bacterium]|nr:CocE/NonD family hydrolase [Solirubrobacterales bacterium]